MRNVFVAAAAPRAIIMWHFVITHTHCMQKELSIPRHGTQLAVKMNFFAEEAIETLALQKLNRTRCSLMY